MAVRCVLLGAEKVGARVQLLDLASYGTFPSSDATMSRPVGMRFERFPPATSALADGIILGSPEFPRQLERRLEETALRSGESRHVRRARWLGPHRSGRRANGRERKP